VELNNIKSFNFVMEKENIAEKEEAKESNE
jgi:hypothetical protein